MNREKRYRTMTAPIAAGLKIGSRHRRCLFDITTTFRSGVGSMKCVLEIVELSYMQRARNTIVALC